MRKIFINQTSGEVSILPAKVTVVIANYNNGEYLSKCLNSVISQTLQEIEIIIVDDSSTDESLKLIQEYASRDPRIRLIAHNKNMGTFITRKDGILAARAPYLMFLDSDDSLEPEACEIALGAIKDKYDIVTFCFNMLADPEAPWNMKTHEVYLNQIRKPFYTGSEIVESFFGERSSPWNLIGKIFATDVCQKAYAQLPDDYYIFSEDIYDLLAIANNAQSMHRVGKYLYNYNCEIGVSHNPLSLDRLRNWFSLGCTYQAFSKYCQQNNLPLYYKKIYGEFIEMALNKIINAVPADHFPEFVSKLISQYGIYLILKYLVKSIYQV